MNELIFIRYIHFISFMVVFAMVFAESRLVHENMTRADLRRVFKIDGIYGLFALIVLGAGLYLWFGTGKPADYYSNNPIFWIKVILFLIVGILSIWPTMFFYKQGKGHSDEPVIVPRRIRFIIRVELTLLVIIPLLATLMAQGVGL
ncbi:MAG: DUF2214 family protein [Fulvivirga sp.]|uniref:DUF2214 family protein n=1 Tax=Fulvivirga sp. TaxID=1931237 RepID=UPI0032EAEB2E